MKPIKTKQGIFTGIGSAPTLESAIKMVNEYFFDTSITASEPNEYGLYKLERPEGRKPLGYWYVLKRGRRYQAGTLKSE